MLLLDGKEERKEDMEMHRPVAAEMTGLWKPCLLSINLVLVCIFSKSAVGGFHSYPVSGDLATSDDFCTFTVLEIRLRGSNSKELFEFYNL